ncbi:hypothetical protein PVK06_023952 [Gossypium arboreum]|uniref:Uncharacterized protein n=1 Tax=Gossypium arboreum TaxID=29729 RepID=A0ABR0PCQ5_GOSAR|nr:hypothetical protein PVK06_023952 [Gossypium arboreum]
MGDADGFNMDRNTKKVKFKDVGDDSTENMVIDTALASEISWKDKMLGVQNTESLASSVISDGRSTDGGLGRVSELVGELVNFDQPINHGPEIDNFAKASSLHFNPMFEGPIETMVNLNSKLLYPNFHSVVIFKENWDPNSNSKIGKEGVVAYNSPPISSKGHNVGNKGGNGYPRRVLNKTIRGRWGCFKPTSNPRVPLLEVMNSMAKLFSAQVETLSTKVDVQNSGVKAYDTS